MMELPTGMRGRVVALSLPAILLLVLLLGIVMPLVDYWRAVDAEHTQLFNKTRAYERLASRRACARPSRRSIARTAPAARPRPRSA